MKGNERYWYCGACQLTTSLRYGTVLYKSKMKLNNFVILAYCFTERNRTKSTSRFFYIGLFPKLLLQPLTKHLYPWRVTKIGNFPVVP